MATSFNKAAAAAVIFTAGVWVGQLCAPSLQRSMGCSAAGESAAVDARSAAQGFAFDLPVTIQAQSGNAVEGPALGAPGVTVLLVGLDERACTDLTQSRAPVSRVAGLRPAVLTSAPSRIVAF